MPLTSFMLAHPSVTIISSGCDGDIKAKALQCWHQAGTVLRPEDGRQALAQVEG